MIGEEGTIEKIEIGVKEKTGRTFQIIRIRENRVRKTRKRKARENQKRKGKEK